MRDPQYDLEAVQDYFGFSGLSVVEKDLEVIKVLRIFSEIEVNGLRFVFAGGTCLARAHRIVERMSEDLDIKIVLSPELTTASRNKQRKVLSSLKDTLIQELANVGLRLDDGTDEDGEPPIVQRNENRYVRYRLTYDRRTNDASVLDPRIKVETVVSALRRDMEYQPVSSLAAQAYGRDPEVARIGCISVAETAAEKIVSLTRRVAAKLEGDVERFDNRIIRHVYDLHMIRESIDLAEVGDMAREIARQDAVQFGNQHPRYAEDPEEATRQAMLVLVGNDEHRLQYEAFLKDMVYGAKIQYSDAIQTVVEIAAAMWDCD